MDTDTESAGPSSTTAGRRPPDRWNRRHALTVAGSAFVFAVFAAAVRLGWLPLLAVDTAVTSMLNDFVSSRPWLIYALTAVTTLGSAGVLIWLVVLAAIVLVVRRRYRLAVFLLVTAAGAPILDPTTKAVIGRLRPEVAHPLAYGGGSSFPSGHALDSLICYGALTLVALPALGRYRRLAPAALGSIVFLIGLSRVMLGVHFASDVLGGWCLAVVWLGLTVYAFEVHREHIRRPATDPLTEGLEPEASADLRPTDPTGRETHLWRSAAWLTVGWVFTLGLVVGLGEPVVRGGGDVLGDRSVPLWLAAHRSPWLDGMSRFWGQAGNTHGITAVCLMACAVVLAATRRWRPVLFLVVVMVGEVTLFLASARIIGRERPQVVHLDGPVPTSAYPSGHVAATVCLFGAVAVLAFGYTGAWWRWTLVALAVTMPVLVALSRMYRGMHHPTDVMASVLLAAAWIGVCHYAIRPRPDRRGHPVPAAT